MTPGVAPAEGPAWETDTALMHVPRGYRIDRTLAPVRYFALSRTDPQDLVGYGEVPKPLGPSDDLDGLVRAMRKFVVRFGVFDEQPRRLPDVTIDGRPAYHVRGIANGRPADQFGLVVGDYLVDLKFELDGSDAERDALIDSVLQTVEWKRS